MPSFASGLAAGLSPGIKFYGDRLAQDRSEKLFDARLADQRKYAVMQGLISEARRVGIPANEIADMERYGNTDAFASVLEERTGDFDAGSSPAHIAPTKEQSESSSFLYGQRLRNQKQAVEDFKAKTALGVVISAEDRATVAVGKQIENVRNYQVRQELTKRANQAGMDPTAVSDMESIGDLDLYSALAGEAERDYSAGLSFVNADSTPEQLRSPSFLKGRRSRDDKDEIAKRDAAESLAVKIADEIRAAREREVSAKNVWERADLVGLRERGVKAGMPQEVLNDLDSFGDPKAVSGFVRQAEEDFSAGSSLAAITPTPGQLGSRSFQFGQQVKAENAARELALSQKIEAHEDSKAHKENVRALQGTVGSIENLSEALVSRLFSKDIKVRDEAFDDISRHTVSRLVTDLAGNKSITRTYVRLPPPSDLPTEPTVDSQISDLRIWRKLPVFDYPNEELALLNSDDPNVWSPALQRIKSNTTRRLGPGIGTQPTYHWTPGSSSFPRTPAKSSPRTPVSTNY